MKEKIDSEKLPEHIAVIMDGNGRWAKSKGAARVFGHKHAIKAVRDVTEGCAELGVKYLTLYAIYGELEQAQSRSECTDAIVGFDY